MGGRVVFVAFHSSPPFPPGTKGGRQKQLHVGLHWVSILAARQLQLRDIILGASVVFGLTTDAMESLAPDAPGGIAGARVCVQGRRNKAAIRS